MARDGAFWRYSSFQMRGTVVAHPSSCIFPGGNTMKTSMGAFVMGVAGCFSSALLQAALAPPAVAADSAATLSLLQQSSVTEAVAKAQVSGTAPIVTSPTSLVLRAQKG